uniref:Uncharacterized protein n=1 Tax=Rhizophora mucronata TaxID=61149 RepID=A0A2P2PPI9_RHIMU
MSSLSQMHRQNNALQQYFLLFNLSSQMIALGFKDYKSNRPQIQKTEKF